MSSIWPKQHEKVSNMDFAWERTAESRLHASDVLRERVDKVGSTPEQPPSDDTYLAPIELMLRGMAVECLLKAIWVHKGNKLSNNGKPVKIPAPNHDLVKIAEAVGLTLDSYESDLLMRLSHFTEYPGRYPAPMNASRLELQPSPSGGRAQATHWGGADNKAFDGFVARLEKCLT